MARSTTPTPTAPSDSAIPNTPGMSVQRQTPIPSTPGHRRIASHPHTPGTSPLTTCSSSPSAFTVVKVHTAKCSECDKRNMDVMRRCPGCTFQVCKPCQEKREKSGRSLAHGNMLSPQVATPRTGGSVVRRRPVGVIQSVGKKGEKKLEEEKGKSVGVEAEDKGGIENGRNKKRAPKPAAKPRAKPKPKAREVTPSDDSSDDNFAPDPASPTSNKRRRTELSVANRDDIPPATGGSIKPLPSTVDKLHEPVDTDARDGLSVGKPLSDRTTDEMRAHYGVNTSTNPYKAHLLSRQEHVVSNPVIQIPEVVKRGFKPRPSAEEIQKNIQEKVREKMGLPVSAGSEDSDE